jgi:carboxyl-terminal processing protease
MSRRNLLILLLATVVSYACYVRGEDRYARYLAEGLTNIQEYSLESVPPDELFDGAMHGMVDVLHQHGDAHSQYLNEAEANPLRSEIHQQFGGVGVRIGFKGDPRQLTITSPPDAGSPAARAKLRPGNFIVAIDDRPTASMNMNDVLRLVRGEPGTTVRFTIEHAPEAKQRTVDLVREVIQIESVLGDRRDKDGNWQFRLEGDPKIAHVRITSFGDRTATEFANVMKRLTDEGAQGIVLDLRDNPGGSLDAAVAVCEMLLPAESLIVETRGHARALIHRYSSGSDGRYRDFPIAVVINQNTASAGEIVAACLQDHGRVVVAGQRTFGKGTVQQLLPLESGKSLLKLTWASFWRPSGANIHRAAGASEDANWGVLPDAGYEHKLSAEEYKAYRDYRDKRDGFDDTELIDGEKSGGTKATGFVDTQLQLAVDCLRRSK